MTNESTGRTFGIRSVAFATLSPLSLASLFGLILLTTLAGCERPDPEVTIVAPTLLPAPTDRPVEEQPSGSVVIVPPPTPLIYRSPTPLPEYQGTPTPDPTRADTGQNPANYRFHQVAVGETLGLIAGMYGSTVEELMTINDLSDSDFLAVDQEILVPGGEIAVSPSFKLIPDSELVYGPGSIDFDLGSVVAARAGYLLDYQEEVEGQILIGPEVVQLVADRYSVNPRLLLALLEHRSGWLTQTTPTDDGYPMGHVKEGFEGLYMQLGWAANLVNLGYYGRSEGGVTFVEIGDDVRVAFANDINDGTAGLQQLFAAYPETTYESWLEEVGPNGIFETYKRLFGNPFAYTIDPLWPADLEQPPLELPWSDGETWYFTSGPHGGWASGSAWAALDFAPPRDQLGCHPSQSWVTAMSDGLVTRSGNGAVVVDLDGDGYAGTGWAITYMHVESRDRVPIGKEVKTGERLGHPSCEGGFSNGTHVHIARTYNGRWVSADGPLPLIMGGWVSQGLGREYDGLLIRGELAKEACGTCAEEGNAITVD